MSKQTRGRRGRYVSDWRRAERALALALILSVAWWHLHDATNSKAEELDALRREHIELLQKVDALTDSAIKASNTIENPERWRTRHEVELTAYSCAGVVTPEQRAMNCPNGITATGTTPKVGRTVACAPELLGTRITIAGIGERVCEDTGGRIGRGKVDMYVNDIPTALAFGRRVSTFTINE